MAQLKQAGLASRAGKQGWQARGRWFKLSWGQSLFVGGNVRLGYVSLGGRDWVGAASFFFIIFLT